MEKVNFKDVIARSPFIYIIGVAGDSGSGKTTFTESIRQVFGPLFVSSITLDDYHLFDRKERKELGITPLNPKANNIAKLEEDISRLKQGLPIDKPVYDHLTGSFKDSVPFIPTRIIILEGLHTLFTPKLRSLIDIGIYVDPKKEVKTLWKTERDSTKRGYSIAELEKEIIEREPDYISYILPQREWADVIISISNTDFPTPRGNPEKIYRVTLCQTKSEECIREIELSIDLFSFLAFYEMDFLLMFRTTTFANKLMGSLTLDGSLRLDAVLKLEHYLEKQTRVRPINLFFGKNVLSATDIIKLILSWRIINRRIFIEYGDVCLLSDTGQY